MSVLRKVASRLALGAVLGLGAMSLHTPEAAARGYVELQVGGGYRGHGYERPYYGPPYHYYGERHYYRHRDADWWRWHRWQERRHWRRHHHRHHYDRDWE